MRRLMLVLSGLVWLSGCAGESVCNFISPPAAVGPTAQNDQRVALLSTGDPTATGRTLGQQHCH